MMTIKGGISQACAACKYQRRRCTPNCPLAPYFPADQPKIFQNAHRLFGVANMSRILRHIRDDEKDDAMQSIKYESNMWERFPQRGCCEVIQHLKYQIQSYEADLCYIRSLVEMVRKENFHAHQIQNDPESPSPSCVQFKQLSIDPQYRHRLNSSNNNVMMCDEGTSYDAEVKPVCVQQQQPQTIQAPLLPDDRESCSSDQKEACNSSNGSAMKGPMQSCSENDLKNAAACFSLNKR